MPVTAIGWATSDAGLLGEGFVGEILFAVRAPENVLAWFWVRVDLDVYARVPLLGVAGAETPETGVLGTVGGLAGSGLSDVVGVDDHRSLARSRKRP